MCTVVYVIEMYISHCILYNYRKDDINFLENLTNLLGIKLPEKNETKKEVRFKLVFINVL